MRIFATPNILNALLVLSGLAPIVATNEFFPLRTATSDWYENGKKDAFLDELVASMTIPELGMIPFTILGSDHWPIN